MAEAVQSRGRSSTRSGNSAASQSHHRPEDGKTYVSPRELARRWCCSRSTADRIAERAHLTRVCLGEGRNGIVRYLWKEVEEFEQSRMLGQ